MSFVADSSIPEEGISGTKTPIQESGIKEEHCVSDQLEKKELQSPLLSTLDCLTQDEMNRSPAIQPLARTSVHSDEEHSDKAPNSPDLIADHQLEDPAQERDPTLDTENTTSTPSEEDVGTLTLGSGDVPAVSCSLDHGPIPTADCDDKKKVTKKKNRRQKKSKAKKMKKNKPSPAIASSTHCCAITKVLEDRRPWWIVTVLSKNGHLFQKNYWPRMLWKSVQNTIQRKLNHPNIVKLLFDPWKEDGTWHFPLEFIDGEDLEKVLFKQRDSRIKLSRSAKVTIINGMCHGLSFLHDRNIVHQDLKPDNIMIEYGTFRPVLVDFGVAKITSSTGFSTATNNGNTAYAAPEVFQGSHRNKSTDIWAMGKIITELLLGSIVETEKCGCRYVEEILKGMPYAKSVSQMVYTDPHRRVEMKQILGDIEMAGEAFKREGYIDDALISNTMFQGRTEVTKKLYDPVEKRSVYGIPDVGGAMLPFNQASSDRAYFSGTSLGRDPLMEMMDSFRTDMNLANFPQTEVIKHETQKLLHYTARGNSDNMSAVIREGRIEKVQGRVMDFKYSERNINPQQ
ncbi:UNVERIFIED_CONTAM: hypothetical protein FKN15_026061 [Acipenser sinensis]